MLGYGECSDRTAENMSQNDLYKVGLQNEETFPKLDKEPVKLPEWGDQCRNTDKLLMRGDTMARGSVVCLEIQCQQ